VTTGTSARGVGAAVVAVRVGVVSDDGGVGAGSVRAAGTDGRVAAAYVRTSRGAMTNTASSPPMVTSRASLAV
jgi:hypothetical protein